MLKANSTKGRIAQHKVTTDHYLAKFPLTNYMRIIKSPLVVSQVRGSINVLVIIIVNHGRPRLVRDIDFACLLHFRT